MTPPTLTPAEQIARFVEQHPGEWQAVGSPFVPGGAHDFPDGASLSTAAGYVVLIPGVRGVVVSVSKHGHEAARVGQTSGADILTRIAVRIADACQIYEVAADTLPPWLAGPVSHQLINRARALLTSAGISPADAVMAAETLDEYLVSRGVVEVTGILPTLLEIGMSCRWAKGYDEADDYTALVSRRLAALAGECETLRAAIKQAVADLDAYSETDKGVRIATLPARAALRRVLGVT